MNTALQDLETRKNNLYRNSYRSTLKWIVRLLFLAVVLSGILTWMAMDRKQPAYYAAMTSGEIVPMHSLSEPVITNDFIVSWSGLTARKLFNYDFNDYQQKLDEVRDRFTEGGWEKIQAALKSSGVLNSVINNKLVVNSVVVGAPVIQARMIVNGRFTWRVQMKLLVEFTSASQKEKESFVVTMDIQRIPTLNAAQGIQIDNFSAVPSLD